MPHRGIADEPRLDLTPLVEVALACGRRQRPQIQVVTLAFQLGESSLARSRSVHLDGALVLTAEAILQVRPALPHSHERESEKKRGYDRHTQDDPFPGLHPTSLVFDAFPEGGAGNPCKPSVSARHREPRGGYFAVLGESRREFTMTKRQNARLYRV